MGYRCNSLHIIARLSTCICQESRAFVIGHQYGTIWHGGGSHGQDESWDAAAEIAIEEEGLGPWRNPWKWHGGFESFLISSGSSLINIHGCTIVMYAATNNGETNPPALHNSFVCSCPKFGGVNHHKDLGTIHRNYWYSLPVYLVVVAIGQTANRRGRSTKTGCVSGWVLQTKMVVWPKTIHR